MPAFSLSRWTSLKRLHVWQKCALIGVPFLLPIAALLYLVVSQNNDQIAIAQAELRGLDYLRPVKQLTGQMSNYRGLTYRALNGDRAAEAERAKAAAAIDDTIREVDQADARLGAEFKTTEKWQAVKDGWKAARGAGGAPDAVFQQQTDLIAKVLDVAVDVWEYSTLALDPVSDTYYLQDLMIARGIPGIEDIGQVRDILAGAAARNPAAKFALTDEEKLRVNILVGSLESARAAFEKESRNAVRANPALKARVEPPVEEYKSKLDAFLAKVRPLLGDGAARPATADVYASGTDAAVAVSKLYDGFDPALTELLQQRVAGYRRTSYLAAIGTVIGLILVGAVVALVTRSITRPVNHLNEVFGRIEAGDYATRAAIGTEDELGKMAGSLNAMLDKTLTLVQSKDEKDEIQRSIMKLLDEVSGVGEGDLTRDAEVSADITGAIADSFNHTIEQLRKLISNVQGVTLRVATAATEIRASTDHLASGSENQAEQIVGMSAAIDEMAVSVQQVSENAALSATVAQQALQNAKQGNAAVHDTIDGMSRIREQAQETAKRIKRLGETSQEIGQIVQLIDDIADRTSILALNASIQAAAAGDAGRGFAVVAEEVERLAVRSTEATKKIAALVKAIQTEAGEAVGAMERNIQEVVGGSKVANQAGQSLQEIEGVSVKLADLIQSIALASKQQARGSDALAKSMGDINQITQQTAAGSKQTAESVTDLARLADDLRGSVSTFRLPANMIASLNGSNGNGTNGHGSNGNGVNGHGKKELAGRR